MEQKIYGTFLAEEDKTIVWLDTYSESGYLTSSAIVGWYCGEPNDEDTQRYSHGGEDLIARFDV